jgi:hypothetical protein
MKLDSKKMELKKINDNIFKLTYDNVKVNFWSPKILLPFGLDNEYNKYLIRLELDEEKIEHVHFKKILLQIEKNIKDKLELNSNEFKSIIKHRESNKDLIELKIKTFKNNIITKIEYEDKENNYLKTIYDLPKQSYVKVLLEIDGIWDYRIDKKENNKVGLTVFVNKIIVLK